MPDSSSVGARSAIQTTPNQPPEAMSDLTTACDAIKATLETNLPSGRYAAGLLDAVASGRWELDRLRDFLRNAERDHVTEYALEILQELAYAIR